MCSLAGYYKASSKTTYLISFDVMFFDINVMASKGACPWKPGPAVQPVFHNEPNKVTLNIFSLIAHIESMKASSMWAEGQTYCNTTAAFFSKTG